MSIRPLEIIDFPAPYENTASIEQIADHTRALAHNQLPAFQVDVGNDRFLAGTLAVQAIIEASIDDMYGSDLSPQYTMPFRFSFQNLRAPFYFDMSDARSTTMPPHVDRRQIGPAIHKQHAGSPTRVQFGYVSEEMTLPPFLCDYQGPDLVKFADTVYEGTTHLGRLSIFSQGNAHWDMKPAAHYFMRETGQLIGGRYTRYNMLDPATKPYPQGDAYNTLVAMRKAASVHLDWQQWRILEKELNQYGHMLPGVTRMHYADQARLHLDGHPGEHYRYWSMTDDVGIAYGVLPTDTQDAALERLLTLYDQSASEKEA